ncbi:Cytochrome b-c1 complex subunit 9, mitochondrial [Friedmanniomyces endolithicus]|uniref:Complex III subunit 9 n=1 Tax=Friedmanniomyces endolithicus TaxID=329885 RepID=A0A4U0V9U2_9PEZI|nr:qcr9 subunit 9 of the ubiquinol cytochrome-c reductase complex [Friedmanniomyces endolithicus]KAK0268811.1 qcr9 subunit 9 of the ubiquinol cytochrome-c reductase complex [Friedmanniomyces endolithicus]KAK0307555.1 qcr9 subunit 9 of the ubiquinol cytochrome-c reductase complex [Friedmanniomyces endolithicus]KAK0321165.1 qcr9 subunit 9 of the ubiquinol cytochrome-c reductase complex [Friedmanniomyces endolithicus]KAK0922923.1 Cytochrome b-c1 complex subunit 9, mitochondrial [Friedmanniomyces e
MPAPNGFLGTFYSLVIRRNFGFLGVIFLGAFATEIAFETTANGIWNSINRGRQWKDIKQRYMEHDE